MANLAGVSGGGIGQAISKNVTTAALSSSLRDFDPTLSALIWQEKARQHRTIDLIASENFTPRYCSEALASCLSTKYSEGLPGNRYYAGNAVIDQIENICKQRALQAFGLSADRWGVNVQALSGSPANFAVYTALLQPGDTILGLDLPHGGHLSHGFQTKGNKLTATSKYFNTVAYHLDPETELIDYKEVERLALKHKPKMIIAGASAYPRLLDYAEFRRICDLTGAYLMADVAHIAGLIAAGTIPGPFEYADVVTTTTHKTLRGPRSALIFGKKKLMGQIDKAVFPACQGGPHNHTIAAIAAAMLACTKPEFKIYQNNICQNAKVVEKVLQRRGIRLVSGGTDNHMVLADLTATRVSGKLAETVLDAVGIVTNKNTVLTDKSPQNPKGLRLGTPAMTSRGMGEAEFAEISNIIADVIGDTALATGDAKKDKAIDIDALLGRPTFQKARHRVLKLASAFPVPDSTIFPNVDLQEVKP